MVAISLTTICVVVGVVEVKALEAKEHADNPPKVVDAAYCLKCHNTPKGLKELRMKEGTAGFLFNKDGTLRDPKFTALHKGLTPFSHATAYPATPITTSVPDK